jgi:hypothetical protein
MTVAELIEKLSLLPQDLKVVISTNEGARDLVSIVNDASGLIFMLEADHDTVTVVEMRVRTEG